MSGGLPGNSLPLKKGVMCDHHPDRPAVTCLQGETDSFGHESHDLCGECAKQMRSEMAKPNIGRCDWCKTDGVRLHHARDYDEGMHGPVYEVCKTCIDKQHEASKAELTEYNDRYGYWD